MHKWFVLLTFLFITHASCKDNLCKIVSTFDAVCKQNDILYILSANPCRSPTSVSLTIINFKNGTQYKHKVLDRDTTEPIPIWNDKGKGVVLVQHVKPGSENVQRYYRQARLHVLLYLVDIKAYTENAIVNKNTILSVKFPMFTSDCSLKKFMPTTETHPSCHYGHVLGNHSSFCVIPRKSSISATNKDHPLEPGVYIIIADACTVPYSVTIISLLFSGYTVKRTFTQDKSDTYVTLPGGQPKCGLVLLMQDHFGMHLHVQLLYGCSGEDIIIIDSTFQMQSGVICPLSNCVAAKSVRPLAKSCIIPWIHGKDETREAHIEVILNICNFPTYSVWWNYHMHENKQHDLTFEGHDVLKIGERKAFHLGAPPFMHDKVSTNDGYLYLDWGTVSVFIRGTDDLVFVTVLRHYPLPNDSIPLFRTDFWVKDLLKTKSTFCPKIEDKSLKTGLPIAAVGLFIFVFVLIFLYWRRRRMHRQEGGLPYEIHLGEVDDEEVPEFRD